MKSTLLLIIIFLSLNCEAQEIIKDTIYFKYDTQYLDKVNDEIFIVSEKSSKSGFRFLIKEIIHLDDNPSKDLDFKQFLILNNFLVNDNILVSKFIIHTKNKQLFFIRKEKKGYCLYKVVSKIVEM